MRSWARPEVPRLPPPGDREPLRVFDSATRGLVPLEARDVAKLYVCGITPYDATHLGHAATYLAFDTLVRVWTDRGVRVDYVQNVTDVDDPLLERAARDGLDWRDVAGRETDLFRADMAALRVLPPGHYVGAVESIPSVADRVVELLDKGAAYRLAGPDGDDVYFSVGSAPGFGEVSGLDRASMVELSAARGGDPDRPGKKDPLDCLLWLAARPGEPSWPSPLGPGRPGWHIECAAISLGIHGPVVDVLGGGSDLVFPHHELSAAEAAVLSGRWPAARAFVHAGMVGLDGEKMSKSRGNLVFVSRLLAAGTDPAALRLALLSAHYRADREWSAAILDEATTRLRRWREGAARPQGPDGAGVLRELRAALDDDLDTPAALAVVDGWCAAEGTSASGPATVQAAVDALLGVSL